MDLWLGHCPADMEVQDAVDDMHWQITHRTPEAEAVSVYSVGDIDAAIGWLAEARASGNDLDPDGGLEIRLRVYGGSLIVGASQLDTESNST